MIGFELLVENLRNIGFYNFFLPWILILAISYGILKKTEALGDDNTVIAIVSLVISFLALGGLYTFIPVDFFAVFFSQIAVLIVAILAIAILLGMLGVKFEDLGESKGFKWVMFIVIAILVIALIVFYIFRVKLEGLTGFLSSESFLNVVWLLVMVGLIILVVWFITKGGGGE